MPAVNPNENHDDYISRCMSHDETKSKYPDEKQRYAVCNSLYEKAKAKEWAKSILLKDDTKSVTLKHQRRQP